jgi:hypothetical protein
MVASKQQQYHRKMYLFNFIGGLSKTFFYKIEKIFLDLYLDTFYKYFYKCKVPFARSFKNVINILFYLNI